MLWHVLRLALFSLLFMPFAWAGNSFALVLSENSAPYKEFANSFNDVIQDSKWKICALLPENATDASNAPDLIVTVGINAFRQTLQRHDNIPILATLIGRQMYQKILAESGRPRQRSSAIYIEQPLSRQAAFVRQLLPGKTRAGLLVSSESRSELAGIRQAFSAAGFTLDTEDSETDESLVPASSAIFERSHFLLATPDPKIYKRDQIKTLLLNSYRHQKPVIAFSSAFVSAGALAAIYSTPRQIAKQTAETVLEHGSNLPPPQYPVQYSVSINRSVAEALNLGLGDEAEIRRALMANKEFR